MNKEFITLPKGVAVYPRLSRPDTKFKELGEYKADIKVSVADAEPIIKKLQAIAKAHIGKALPKAKNSTWYAELDDNEDPTGFIIFKVRVSNRNTKDGKLWDRRPAQIDAQRQVVNTALNVWGGSVIRPKCEIYCWEFSGKKGISLQPVVVQIIDLVTGSGDAPGGVDTDGFDEEEGFAASDVDTSDFEDEDTTADAAPETSDTDDDDY